MAIEKYYTEKEAATFCKRSWHTLRNWRLAGDTDGPPYLKDKKGKVVYRESELVKWIEGGVAG